MQVEASQVHMQKNKTDFSANALKLIAILAMTLDHLAWAFLPLNSYNAQIFHLLGRLAAPIMSFLIVEGYFHTRDVKKYALRLALLAVVSHFSFQFFNSGHWPLEWKEGHLQFFPFEQSSVIFTLLLSLIALIIYRGGAENTGDPYPLALLCVLSLFGDWMFFVVLWVYYFAVYREDEGKRFRAFTLIALSSFVLVNLSHLLSRRGLWWEQLYQIGVLLAWPLLKNYDQRLGGGGKTVKYLFYLYYPLHLILIRSLVNLLSR